MIWWLVGSLALAGELRIDLQGAVDLAWDRAGLRAVGEARVEAARQAARGERIAANPELRVRASNLGSRVSPARYTVRVRQDLAPPGALRSAGRAASTLVAVEAADQALEREQLRWETVEAFDAHRVALAAEVLAEDEVVLCRRRLELANRRLAAGLQVADDVLDAEIAVLAAVRRARVANLERVETHGALAALVDLPAGDVLVPEGPDLEAVAMDGVEDGSRGALARLAEAEAEAAEALVRAEQAARRPFLNWVEAGMQVRGDRLPSFQVAAGLDIPVFSLADRAVHAARAEVAEHRAMADGAARLEAQWRARARERLVVAQASVQAIRQAVDAAEARLAELGDRIPPDRRVDYEVELLQERRRLLDVVAEAVLARRIIEG